MSVVGLVLGAGFMALVGLALFLMGADLVAGEFKTRALRRDAKVDPLPPLDGVTLFLGVMLMAISCIPFRTMVILVAGG